MTITEFLLARIAEDEADARTMQQWIDDMNANPPLAYEQEDPPDAAFADPNRVLAECEAKRRIIDEHPRCDVHDRPGAECDACQRCGDGSIWPCDTLLALASVYADHPDFDPTWQN
ncbi:DUF6221 family protein [Nocardioides sp. BYT-33-1]|uniref:DUF6221 family protein n=1 Tax=Nocardioides sp. BYT-33-1 TaxID=3416952 RepID=UPI003F52F37E